MGWCTTRYILKSRWCIDRRVWILLSFIMEIDTKPSRWNFSNGVERAFQSFLIRHSLTNHWTWLTGVVVNTDWFIFQRHRRESGRYRSLSIVKIINFFTYETVLVQVTPSLPLVIWNFHCASLPFPSSSTNTNRHIIHQQFPSFHLFSHPAISPQPRCRKSKDPRSSRWTPYLDRSSRRCSRLRLRIREVDRSSEDSAKTEE